MDKILWDYHTIILKARWWNVCKALCIAMVLTRRNFFISILIVINLIYCKRFQNILVHVTVESTGSLSLLSNNIHVVIQTFFFSLQRPYKCKFEGCDKCFFRPYHLKRHAAIHSGEQGSFKYGAFC